VDINNISGSVKNADNQMYIEKRDKKKQPPKITQILNRIRSMGKKAA